MDWASKELASLSLGDDRLNKRGPWLGLRNMQEHLIAREAFFETYG